MSRTFDYYLSRMTHAKGKRLFVLLLDAANNGKVSDDDYDKLRELVRSKS